MKTTVNINEISQGLPEMEKANKEICELKAKLKEYEGKMIDLSAMTLSTTCNSTMMLGDTTMTEVKKESDFTV